MVFWLCFQVGVFSSWGKVLFLDFFHFVVKNVIARNAKNYGELHDEAISDCNSQTFMSPKREGYGLRLLRRMPSRNDVKIDIA